MSIRCVSSQQLEAIKDTIVGSDPFPAIEFFYCNNLNEAKEVILTPGGGMTPTQRWEVETKWLTDRISFSSEKSLVIDYGCGIGRMDKEISNTVLGVDVSVTLRHHADQYVNDASFGSVGPTMFKDLVDHGLKADGVVAIWSFQHIININETIDTLMKALNPDGILWLLDTNKRYLPVVLGTIGEDKVVAPLGDDGIKIYPLIEKWCNLENIEILSIYAPEWTGELRKYRRL